MRSHGRHARTAANKQFFCVGVFQEEFAVRSGYHDFVSRLARKNIGGTDPGFTFIKAPLVRSQGGVAIRTFSMIRFPSAGWLAIE